MLECSFVPFRGPPGGHPSKQMLYSRHLVVEGSITSIDHEGHGDMIDFPLERKRDHNLADMDCPLRFGCHVKAILNELGPGIQSCCDGRTPTKCVNNQLVHIEGGLVSVVRVGVTDSHAETEALGHLKVHEPSDHPTKNTEPKQEKCKLYLHMLYSCCCGNAVW